MIIRRLGGICNQEALKTGRKEKVMKISLILGLLLVSGIIFSAMEGDAQMRQGMMAGRYGGGSGPYCGQSSIPGGMMGPGHMGQNAPDGGQFVIRPCSQQLQKPLDKDQASRAVENYLKSTGNPNLKLGKIAEKGENFEANILTKNDSLVDKILINRETGEMLSEY